jgi:hypothetical protein
MLALKPPRHPGMNAVVRHGLERRVVDAYGQVHANVGAELVRPGEIDLRPQVNSGHAGIFSRCARECIQPLVFPRHHRLQAEGKIISQDQEGTRTACPRQIVGELIAEIPLAADGIFTMPLRNNLPDRTNTVPPTMPSKEPLPKVRS